MLGTRILGGDVLGQPVRQVLCIIDAALPKAQMLTYLGTVVLDRAASPLVGRQVRGRDLHLQSDELHDFARQVVPVLWELAVIRVELQQ
jgi:hypothetical protein